MKVIGFQQDGKGGMLEIPQKKNMAAGIDDR
jgi:hypothetical protein